MVKCVSKLTSLKKKKTTTKYHNQIEVATCGPAGSFPV